MGERRLKSSARRTSSSISRKVSLALRPPAPLLALDAPPGLGLRVEAEDSTPACGWPLRPCFLAPPSLGRQSWRQRSSKACQLLGGARSCLKSVLTERPALPAPQDTRFSTSPRGAESPGSRKAPPSQSRRNAVNSGRVETRKGSKTGPHSRGDSRRNPTRPGSDRRVTATGGRPQAEELHGIPARSKPEREARMVPTVAVTRDATPCRPGGERRATRGRRTTASRSGPGICTVFWHGPTPRRESIMEGGRGGGDPGPRKGAQTMLQIRKKTKRRKNPKRASIHSTMTADQKRALYDLAGSLSAQGDRVAAGLEARLRTVLEEGEEMPDLRLLLKLFERLLGRSAQDLDDTDADGWKQAMRLRALRFECRRGEERGPRRGGQDPQGPGRARRLEALPLPVRPVAPHPAGRRRPGDRGAAAGLAARPSRSQASGVAPARPRGRPRGLGRGARRRPSSASKGCSSEIEVQRIAVSDGVIARRKALDASAETCRLVMGASQALFALAGEKELARRLRPRRRRRREAARPRRASACARRPSPSSSGCARLLGRLKSTAGAALRRKLPDDAAWLGRRRPLTA